MMERSSVVGTTAPPRWNSTTKMDSASTPSCALYTSVMTFSFSVASSIQLRSSR